MRAAALLLIVAALVSLLPAEPAMAKDLTIAAVAPMSGRYAPLGRSLAIGAQLAVNDINKAGGLRGDHGYSLLALQVIDDKCNAGAAGDIAARLIESNTKLVIGHGCTRPTIAAAKLYAAANIVQIDPLNRHTQFTKKRPGPGIFRLAGRDDQQGEVAGAYLAATYGNSRIAIVHDRTLFTIALAAGVEAGLKRRGITNIFRTTLRSGEKDYAKLVARLAASKATAIYIASYATETGVVTRQFFDAGYKAQIVTPEIMRAPEYLSLAGPAGSSTLLTLAPRPKDFKTAVRLLPRLRQAQVPQLMAALSAYASVQIWRQAAQIAKSTQMDQLAAVMNSRSFQTIFGEISFDEDGNSSLPSYRIYRRVGQEFVPVTVPPPPPLSLPPQIGNPPVRKN